MTNFASLLEAQLERTEDLRREAARTAATSGTTGFRSAVARSLRNLAQRLDPDRSASPTPA